jgi:hypothetical protein
MNSITSIKLKTGSSILESDKDIFETSTSYTDNTYNFTTRLGIAIAATMITSSVTLPNQPISFSSSARLPGVQSSRSPKILLRSEIATFVSELQACSKPLSSEDSQTLRQVILSKSQPGIPRF